MLEADWKSGNTLMEGVLDQSSEALLAASFGARTVLKLEAPYAG